MLVVKSKQWSYVGVVNGYHKFTSRINGDDSVLLVRECRYITGLNEVKYAKPDGSMITLRQSQTVAV